MQNSGKYSMFLGLLVLITALTISGIAIYYSVAGLVAIFAAAALPIMIMGGALEIGKLVTAVWLHRYWKQAAWWLRTYLALAVVILMLITSMGIFGFLSKAHIEQTSASEETVARVETIEKETLRLQKIIERAENKIKALETSGTGADANIQSQIDKEQERIDKAFDRIKPAIEQQNKIITDARGTDANRTKPYEDQLTSITAEILRLETSAKEYETKIENLDTDSSGVEPLLAQIAALEEEIIRVTNQLQSKEQGQVRAGQAIIGVTSDGLFGGNTRTALAKWVQGQRDRITQIQGEVAQVRKDATTTVDAERTRLAGVVKDIRTVQIPALKERELTMLGKIDEVRQTESPVIQTARDEIQRLRESAEKQVQQSQNLIERLRSQLAKTDNADDIQKAIDEQEERVRTASNEIELINDKRIELESEYRKLEAEVGPIKYIAEFVYGEQADKNLLEEAVRWVIITIIFVFDPLAVLLLIASQYTFEWRHAKKEDDFDFDSYERKRAEKIAGNPGPEPEESTENETSNETDETEKDIDYNEHEPVVIKTEDTTQAWQELYGEVETVQEALESNDPTEIVEKKDELSAESKKLTKEELEALDEDVDWKHAKQQWKVDNPDDSIKSYKDWYLSGKINSLPWEEYLPKKKRPYLMKENGQQKKGTAVE
jgi:HAMP domain-containing protein